MKYPKIFHLPYSQSVSDDDRIIDEDVLDNMLSQELIITEKLDGGNTCYHAGKIYARSHAVPTTHESFNWLKNFCAGKSIPDHLMLYGENVFAIHSIEYEGLSSYFYLFDIFDQQKECWLSWSKIIDLAGQLGFDMVPIIYKGELSFEDLKSFIMNKIQAPSCFGGPVEGFVVRTASEIPVYEFNLNRVKFVRANHVQSDEHWTRTWKRQKLF